jgi:hypothetical protein
MSDYCFTVFQRVSFLNNDDAHAALSMAVVKL